MEEQEGEKWRKSEMKESERWIKKRLIGEKEERRRLQEEMGVGHDSGVGSLKGKMCEPFMKSA